jgi:predicted secreted protein
MKERRIKAVPGKGALFVVTLMALWTMPLAAGDTASFVDLGFSPDGAYYMFGQYGIGMGNLKPWADLNVVDVRANNFVPGGRLNYSHSDAVVQGQDGSGALYRLLLANTALVNRYRIDFLLPGRPLYVAPDQSRNDVAFQDVDQGFTYRARLISTSEGSGAGLRSSFHIDVERTARDGSRQSYQVGSPQVQRAQVLSYGIRKIIVAPQNSAIVFVIEMHRAGEGGDDIRYMVETRSLR